MDEYDRFAAALRLCHRMGLETTLEGVNMSPMWVASTARSLMTCAEDAIEDARERLRHEVELKAVGGQW
jgi:hypothetical protein